MTMIHRLVAAFALTFGVVCGTYAAEAPNPKVRLKTDLGDIVLELHSDKAPRTVENFLGYVHDKFYEGVIFHRVIPGYVVQTGGYTYEVVKKPTKDPVINEASNGLSNQRGTVAMARTPDPNSATSQFYINMSDNTSLDASSTNAGYTVFGRVIEGMDVAVKITEEPRGRFPVFRDAPNTPVRILEATIVEDQPANKKHTAEAPAAAETPAAKQKK